jgi:esterase/lipase superfamily enzyme
MYFLTNRIPKQSADTPWDKLPRKLNFDTDNTQVSQWIYFCERTRKGSYQEIGSPTWLKKLGDHAADQILFFIHGYNSLPEGKKKYDGIFGQAQKLQELFEKEASKSVLVVPVIWPCDDDPGMVGDYWDDQRAADMSGYSFSRALQKFVKWQVENPTHAICNRRLNILAHSMGNRVMRQSLLLWRDYEVPQGVPLLFRNIFMFAPDVVNETLEPGQPGEVIPRSCRNLVVYYASDDLALRASKVVNVRNGIASRRLGHTGPEDMQVVPRNVYSVDCDDINISYDSPTGHTYFLEDGNGNPGRPFKHMLSCIESGRVTETEVKMREALRDMFFETSENTE